ncbi:hypothetical protein BH10PLA2_BH10PLA2_24200 [soil metagenome]
MDFETIVRITPDQLSTVVGDEAVILNLDRGAYYGLNVSGADLWQKIQQPTRVGALHDWMLATYEVTPEIAKRDLFALLNKLAELKLIEVVHADSSSVDRHSPR